MINYDWYSTNILLYHQEYILDHEYMKKKFWKRFKLKEIMIYGLYWPIRGIQWGRSLCAA